MASHLFKCKCIHVHSICIGVFAPIQSNYCMYEILLGPAQRAIYVLTHFVLTILLSLSPFYRLEN
jgi:hypothetical protein